MAIALVSNTIAGSPSPGNSVTTSAIDTTGANLIVLCVGYYSASTDQTPTDSKSNTWTFIARVTSGDVETAYWYCLNPTVGSGHTASYAHTGVYATISFAAFSGAAASSPLDQTNSATGTATTSLSSGSVTPTESNELVISAIGTTVANTLSVGSGLTILDQLPNVPGDHLGLAVGYFIQSTAAAINPSWSWSTSSNSSAVIASFKSASVATTFPASKRLVIVS